ncbi:hypothetical protein IFU20_25685 [Pseudomonas viridiflava]|nr:hypothetical protein [Pseudomonas viridiflava]
MRKDFLLDEQIIDLLQGVDVAVFDRFQCLDAPQDLSAPDAERPVRS